MAHETNQQNCPICSLCRKLPWSPGSRLGWLPANVSSLGGFGFMPNTPGSTFFPLLSLINLSRILPWFWWTYVGFAAYPILGYSAETKSSDKLSFRSHHCFSTFSNFGSFWYWYPHTLRFPPLLQPCTAVLFRTLAGDLVFGYGWLMIKNNQKIFKKWL